MTRLVFAALLFIQILFGINYVAVKYLLRIMPASTFNFYRYLASGIILITLAYCYKKIEWKLLKKYWWLFLVSALSGTVCGQMLFAWGIDQSSATNASILSILIPLFTLLVSYFRKQVSINIWKVLSLIGGGIGVLLIKWQDLDDFFSNSSVGDLYIILGCLCFGITISYTKDFYRNVAVSFGTSACFFLGGLVLIPFTPLSVSAELFETSYMSWFIFAVLGGTTIPYLLGNWSIQKVDPFTASLFIYVQPIVTSSLAYITLGEELTTIKIIASAIIFGSVLISQIDSGKQERKICNSSV